MADTHTQRAGYDKSKRRLLWLPLGLVAAAVGTVIGISLHAAYSMTRVPRPPFEKNPGDLGLKHEDISFVSSQGTLFSATGQGFGHGVFNF